MAKIVLDNMYCLLDTADQAADLSASIKSGQINLLTDVVETTCMGSNPKTKLPGLRDWNVQLTLLWDTTVADQCAKLFHLWEANVAFTMSIAPDGSAEGAANPEYSGSVILESWQPFGGGVGEAAGASLTLQGTSTLARDVTP